MNTHLRMRRMRACLRRAASLVVQTLQMLAYLALLAGSLLLSDVTATLHDLRRRAYDALDTRIFPAIERYTTHRAHITFMALLWLALLVGGSWTAFELVGGNYTNGLSGLMTCIIAHQQSLHVRENRAQHAATHERLDDHERRLSAIHGHVAPKPAPASASADDGGATLPLIPTPPRQSPHTRRRRPPNTP